MVSAHYEIKIIIVKRFFFALRLLIIKIGHLLIKSKKHCSGFQSINGYNDIRLMNGMVHLWEVDFRLFHVQFQCNWSYVCAWFMQFQTCSSATEDICVHIVMISNPCQCVSCWKVSSLVINRMVNLEDVAKHMANQTIWGHAEKLTLHKRNQHFEKMKAINWYSKYSSLMNWISWFIFNSIEIMLISLIAFLFRSR